MIQNDRHPFFRFQRVPLHLLNLKLNDDDQMDRN